MTALLLAALALGHELPEDVVQCGVQVVVSPETIELRYQFGLNPETAREALEAWDVRCDPAAPVFPTLRTAAFQRIPQRLHVSVDGLPAVLEPVHVKEVRRHHARVECVYRLPNPASDGVAHEIAIRDDNFAQSPGLREFAVKTRGEAPATADAPQVLGRSDLETLPGEQVGVRQLSVLVGTGAPDRNSPFGLAAIAFVALAGIRIAAIALL